MRRLIRDKIAANMLQENAWCGDENCDHSAHPCRNGQGFLHQLYPISTDHEFAVVLAKTLDEEVSELKRADDSDNALEEAADVLEVLTSIVALHGYTLKDLLRRQHEKHQLSGGFENRYVLETES